MKLLGITNVQTGQATREMLKDKFNPELQKLCNPELPFTNGKFFADILTNATAQLIIANQVQNKTLSRSTTSTTTATTCASADFWSYNIRNFLYQLISSASTTNIRDSFDNETLKGQQS